METGYIDGVSRKLLSPIAACHGTPLSRRGSKRVSADDSDIDLKFVGIDLSADPDIQRVLMKSHSVESLLVDTPETGVTPQVSFVQIPYVYADIFISRAFFNA